MKWISTRDRLPRKNTKVLLYDNGGYGVALGYLGHAGWYVGGILDAHANITHWTFLPCPPNKVKKKITIWDRLACRLGCHNVPEFSWLTGIGKCIVCNEEIHTYL